MNCENCGKNYANVRYTQIINGNKRKMFLCEECSKTLGIDNLNLSIDFSGLLGEVFSSFEHENIFQNILKTKELRCDRCNFSFEDFINTGKFGCEDCYSTFEEKIDPILRNIQGVNRHIGRIGKIGSKDVNKSEKWEESKKEISNSEIENLKKELRKVVKEENYEEAAIIRDKIKKLEGEN